MKTIKIFIASSNELEKERLLMASLANDLSTKLEKVGIQVIAVEWESLDASMGAPHKQDEYNEKLRECDMCMVLYWTKFGMYTKTELDTAYNEKIAGKNPQKLWVYFKEIDDPSKQPTEELKEFRDSFPTAYGHFYTPFANFDTLKAHFLLQFMEYQSQALQGKSIVEVKDGKVTINGKVYVDLQNVPFAGNNKEYKDKLTQLKAFKKILMVIDTDDPDYKDYQEQFKLLQKDIKDMENGLWDTALMITRLSNNRCSERLKRAADLFEKGDNKGARAILNEDEIDQDIKYHKNLIKLGKEGKVGLKTDIEELNLKLKLLSTAEFKFPDEKYNQIEPIFKKILDCTIILYGHDSEETLNVLRKSALYMHNQPKRYIPYFEEALQIRKKQFGFNLNKSSYIYSRLIYGNKIQGNKARVVEIYNEILSNITKEYGEGSGEYLHWLSNFGSFFTEENNVWKAEQIFEQCIELCKNANLFQELARYYYKLAMLYLENHKIKFAKEYFNKYIAIISEHNDRKGLLKEYLSLAKCIAYRNKLAETYYLQALEIACELNDDESQAIIFMGIAEIKKRLGDIQSEFLYLNKALEACPDKNGFKFIILTTLADSYAERGDYNNAMQCGEKAFEYSKMGSERTIEEHQVRLYGLLARIALRFNDLEKSEKYGLQGLEYAIQHNWVMHVYTFYRRLGSTSSRNGNLTQALDYYHKALEFKGADTSLYKKMEFLSLIGGVYNDIGDNEKAEKAYLEAISDYEEESRHLEWAIPIEKERNMRNLAIAYANICRFYIWTTQFDKAQDALSKSFDYYASKTFMLADRDLLQAKIFIGKNMFNEAKHQLESSKPNTPPLIYQWRCIMTELYIDWGKKEEALEWMTSLLNDYTNVPFVYELSVKCYETIGDHENSLKQYEAGLKMLNEARFSQFVIDLFKTKIKQIMGQINR